MMTEDQMIEDQDVELHDDENEIVEKYGASHLKSIKKYLQDAIVGAGIDGN